MNQTIDPCDTQRNNLIAAALGLQQCTRTDGTEVLIPGTGKRIPIGGDAYLAQMAHRAIEGQGDGRAFVQALGEWAAQSVAETTLPEDVAAVFAACGFEIRSTDPAEKHPLAVCGSLDAAGLVAEALVTRQQADALDAARYRHIRNLTVKQAGAPGQPSIALPNGMNSGYYITEETADYAIDESIKEHALGAVSTDSEKGGAS